MSFPYKHTGLVLILLVGSAAFFSISLFQNLAAEIYQRSPAKPEYPKSFLFEQSSNKPDTRWREELWEDLIKSCENQTKAKRLPKIIGIGVEKCGTHALLHFLRPHPLIRVAKPMETHFFDAKPGASVRSYLLMLPEVEKNAFAMEKTPAYFNFRPSSIPANIKRMVPDAKLLLVLCNPVDRVLSDFYQEWIMFNITHPGKGQFRYKSVDQYVHAYFPRIQQAIGDFDQKNSLLQEAKVFDLMGKDYLTHIITTGFYALHLQRWFKYFNETNLMVIDSEAMLQDPGSVIEEVQEFLKLPKVLLKQDYVKEEDSGYFCYKNWRDENKLDCLPSAKRRTRNGNKSLPPDVTSKLQGLFQSHNEALFKMLGRKLWV
ncbi:unnamed protein product [Clavelina lepadiformis]|uniref:Sulfotransferase n=1 Tax=Clavelina lepadiformis TaxID=159417 RepID=A0ABP0FY62_CLALP